MSLTVAGLDMSLFFEAEVRICKAPGYFTIVSAPFLKKIQYTLKIHNSDTEKNHASTWVTFTRTEVVPYRRNLSNGTAYPHDDPWNI